MRIIMLLDMNSYFASVEQQANPLLRGKPVGVCAYLSENGCIIASSIEAKQLGIKTGMRVREARQLCPQIIFLENEPSKYRTVTRKIFSLLAEYTDRVEPYSIDEAFMDMSGWTKDWDHVKDIALEIKKRIQTEIGEWLLCSIGVSFTYFLAKMAAKMQKPDGLTFIKTPEELPFIYQKLSLRDLWGVNYRLERRLNNIGITTPQQLKDAKVINLMQSLGKYGYYLWAQMNGMELHNTNALDTTVRSQPKSIGHSYCLPRKTKDKEYLEAILMKLCEKVCQRLRKQKLEAQTIAFSYGYTHGGGISLQRKLSEPLFSSRVLFTRVSQLMAKETLKDTVNFLSVSVTQLQPPRKQLSLFSDLTEKERLIYDSLDKINNQFGTTMIAWGNMLHVRKNAVDRIGFRKTVDFESKIEDSIILPET